VGNSRSTTTVSAAIRVGTSSHGQGRNLVRHDRLRHLGIPLGAIEFVQSDTALVLRGGGTGGSRSLQMGGSAVLRRAKPCSSRAARSPTPARSHAETS
jgi:carbon-monoxide dehydrogenase large subunit